MPWPKLLDKIITGFPRKQKPVVPDPRPAMRQPTPKFKFNIGFLDDVEDRELYRAGGFHPTDLGDVFSCGRYKVIHKLGYGGFATVWLARDQQANSNVALKILAADATKDCRELGIFEFISEDHSSSFYEPGRAHIPQLLDHFSFDGPNGRHLCLVLPAFGPSVHQVMKTSETRRLSAATARSVSLQATRALATLHSLGLGHGDFRPTNLLFGVKGICQWSEDVVKQNLGESVGEELSYRDGRPAREPGAPTQVVRPTDYTPLIPHLLEKSIHLVDMGEAFHINDPPAKGLGTPASYCAPECRFDLAASSQSDIWALACTIFEIRAGCPLFENFIGTYDDEVLPQIVTMLGKMPEPWWRKWERRDAFFDQDGKSLLQENALDPVTLEDSLMEIGKDDLEHGSSEGAAGVLSQEEVDDLADLLGKMLRYEPSERIDVQDVLQHSWFTKEY